MTDSLQKRPYLSNFKTGPNKPSPDMMGASSKENMHPQIFPAPAAIDLNIETYYQKPNGKRGLMAPAPINDNRSVKKARTEDEMPIPAHDSFPPISDDGTKPQASYAQLIGMAILRSPLRRLTLAQIYKWISDTYSYYNPTDAGWQNSIRHNLSLHKNFIKIERPKDDPGKGNYWAILPGTEVQFLKEKPTRKSASAAENIPVMSTRLEPPRPAPVQPQQEPMLPPPMPNSHATLPPLPNSQVAANELSSDATIIASDGAAPEDQSHAPAENAGDSSFYSPTAAALHSSPPIARTSAARTGTPPPLGRNVNSSATRSHQRKFRSMDDSGYISSLESSALRPHQTTHLLTSEAERPRVRRGRTKDRGQGRAEEEIMRLRQSSPYGPASSSPLRQAHGQQMMPPLTPNVRFKPVLRPPPSASPNTNLRIHRNNVKNILQSPCRTSIDNGLDMPWSPAFNLEESGLNLDGGVIGNFDFNVFVDFENANDFSMQSAIDNGSPVKRPAQRQRLDRSNSASALDDLTHHANQRSVTSAPLLKIPEQTPLDFLETPSKAFEMSSPSKMLQPSPSRNQSPCKFSDMPDLGVSVDWNIDVEDFMMPSHTDTAEISGLDLSQGFERIGSGSQATQSRQGKPALSRSFTTNF